VDVEQDGESRNRIVRIYLLLFYKFDSIINNYMSSLEIVDELCKLVSQYMALLFSEINIVYYKGHILNCDLTGNSLVDGSILSKIKSR
jgi:hypothetical protein